jgi:hypothetical protein
LGEGHEKIVATVPGRVVLGPAVPLGRAPTAEGAGGVKGMQVWSMGTEKVRGALWGDTNFLVRVN